MFIDNPDNAHFEPNDSDYVSLNWSIDFELVVGLRLINQIEFNYRNPIWRALLGLLTSMTSN